MPTLQISIQNSKLSIQNFVLARFRLVLTIIDAIILISYSDSFKRGPK